MVLLHFSFSSGVPYGAPLQGVLGSPRSRSACRTGFPVGAVGLASGSRLAVAGSGWLSAGFSLGFRLDFGLILGLGWLWLRISVGFGFWLSFTRILIGLGLILLDFGWIWLDFNT